ncbi:anthrone oxygenase family protein [Maribellus maritimus]|uniref:anthrone oxygenase family protein n=1 Tax=Maribellus maritimus TaxID=2870838 RepID=UPI001EEA8395|nr:DUF1772 domain-containing protein [Maribellus maritimus]MCG6190058.1 DUF1772 domain-containing protein [Maribellus maritimus]
MNTTILIITIIFSGLMAGLFYSWSISVTPGLAKINNVSYLRAFQSMNRAIINPLFFVVFFGLVILLPLLSYLSYQTSISNQFWYVIFATILYFVGIMGVTIGGNVPLNNALEALQIESMTPEQMDEFRKSFESKWNRLNLIRTISSTITFLLLVIACVREFYST